MVIKGEINKKKIISLRTQSAVSAQQKMQPKGNPGEAEDPRTMAI